MVDIRTEMQKSTRINRIIVVVISGIVINFVLASVKLYVGVSSNSIIIFSDAIHNFMDAAGLFIAILGFLLMRKESTSKFPEGYGRVEYLASFLLSLALLGTGIYFMYASIERMFYPYLVTFTWLRFAVIGSTAIFKVLLGLWYKYNNKTLDSGVLKTAQLDSWLDAFITIMTLIGYSLASYGALRLDAIFGIILSVIIIIGGLKLFLENFNAILGKRPTEALTKSINALIAESESIQEISQIRLHDYGVARQIVVITARFNPDLNTSQIEEVVKEITDTAHNTLNIELKVCMDGGYNGKKEAHEEN
ncbi:MAG: cation diffusion facilitator family transporter [Christensenellaceae bacterium]|jgi:cation diffusion facilitator family transporter|nr:cation diffusion facilitator family transporter [Christensenellaceae bacterium]